MLLMLLQSETTGVRVLPTILEGYIEKPDRKVDGTEDLEGGYVVQAEHWVGEEQLSAY